MSKKKLLILDDDALICKALTEGLASDFDIVTTHDADIAYRIIMRSPPDIILSELHFGMNCGIEFCKKLRSNQLAKNIPILILAGYGTTDKMLLCYEAGADDYIEKPVDLVMIKTRLIARLRRNQELLNIGETFGNLKLYPDRLEVEFDGKGQRLSEIEFNLLRIFLTHPNKKITRDEILKTIWNDTRVEGRTVDVHISSLRRKLKGFNHHIKTLYGSGYILCPVEKRMHLQKSLDA